MNKKLFCILYNAAKGTWVVVRESALARGAARFCGCTPMLTRCGAVLLVLQPMFQLQAQVVAASEASAANRPVVTRTFTQTPLVQIAAPNAAGLSNNHYSQFNVDDRGVILNNARGRTKTQLGGAVNGNPLLLASPSAGIILNQVVGHHPSLLTGSLEVAGARADVILANPNGIVCNGGGFINASRGVLTTGVPVLDAQGGLEAFRVSAGQLQIGPNGLKAADLDWVDLIARSVKVNGNIQAQGQLNVITGANQVAYADLGVEVLPGLAGKPTVGLDVGHLGGMYAHRIHLIGTAAGLGVHSQGTLAARGGFQCTQQGRIMLTGTTTAGGELKLASQGDLANSGTVVGQGPVTLVSQGAVHNLGTLQAKGDLSVKAPGRLVNEGGLIAAEKVTVNAGALANQGGAIKHGGPEAMRLTVKGALDNSGGVIFSHGKDLHLRSASFTNDRGGQIAHAGTGSFSLNTGALNNDTGILVSKGAVGLSATQDLSNVAGTIHADGFLKVQGTNIDNDGGQMVTHGGGLSVVADETLKNAAGTTAAGQAGGLISGKKDTIVQTRQLVSSGAIMAGHYLSLRGTTLTNSGTLGAGTRIEADAQTLANGKGLIGAPSVALKAVVLDNSQGEVTANTLTVKATNLTNQGGQLSHLGAGPVKLEVTGHLDNTQGGLIQTLAPDLKLTPQTLDNTGGSIAHAGAGTLSIRVGKGAGALLNRDGSIASNGGLDVGAGSIGNQGGILIAQTKLEAAALQGDLDNGPSETRRGFIGGNQVRLTASDGKLLNQGGKVEGRQGVTLHAQSLDNTGGSLKNTGDAPLVITAPGAVFNAEGIIASHGETQVAAHSIVNADGVLHAGTDLKATADLIGNAGTIGAGRNLKLQAPTALANSGALTAGAKLEVEAGELSNVKGQITAPSLDLKATKVDNTTGGMTANAMSVTAASLDNAGGTLTHLGAEPMILKVAGTLANGSGGLIQSKGIDLQVEAERLENDGGTIGHLGTGTLSLRNAKGESVLVNTSGKIASLGQLDLLAGTVDNRGGTLAAQHQVKLGTTAGGLDNGLLEGKGGTIGAEKVEVATGQGALLNPGGTIEGSHGVEIKAQRVDNAGGTLINSGNAPLSVTATQTVGNTRGTLGSNGEATVAAGILDNANGTLQGGANLTLQATGGLGNCGGTVHANQDLTITAPGTTVNNAAGQITAAGAVTLQATALDTPGGTVASGKDLRLELATMPADGQIHGGRDSHFSFQGDYTHPAGKSLKGTRNLTLATTGTLTNLGSLAAPGLVTVKAAEVHHEASGLIMGETVEATATQELISKGRLVGTDVTLKSGRELHHGGTLVAKGNATLTSDTSIHNPGNVAAQAHVTLRAPGINTPGKLGAGIDSEGKATLPGNLEVTATGLLAASGDNQAGGNLTLEGGSIAMPKARTHAGGNLKLTATRPTPGDPAREGSNLFMPEAKTSAGGSITLTAQAGGIQHRKGQLTAEGQFEATARSGALANDEGVLAAQQVTVTTAGLSNDKGTISAKTTAKITTTGLLTNTAGVTAAGIPGGVIQGQADTTVHAGQLANTGTLASGQNLTVVVQSLLDNRGALAAQGTALLESQGNIENKGTVSAQRHLTITATGNLTAAGQSTAGGDLTFTGAQVSMPGAKTAAGGNITLTATAGSVHHTHGAKLKAQGKFTATTTSGALVNDDGQIEAHQVSASGVGLSNRGGSITQTGPGEETRLDFSGPLENYAGTLKTPAHRLFIKAASINNGAKGEVRHAGKGLLTIETGRLDNGGGTVTTEGQTLINASQVINDAGSLSAKGTADVTATGDVANAGGVLQSGGAFTLKGDKVLNPGGQIVAPGASLTLTAQGPLENVKGTTAANTPGGVISAKTDTTLNVGALTNTGTLEAGQKLTVATKGLLDNSGSMVAQDKGQFTSHGTIRNTGIMSTHKNLVLTAVTIETPGSLGAGINGEGKALEAAKLQVTATGSLTATGRNTATGDITLSGAQVSMPGAQTTAGKDIALTATAGDLTHNKGAKLQAQGGLLATAASGALVNDTSELAARQITATAASLTNRSGTITQSGPGETRLVLTGPLDNTTGKIKTNGTDLSIEATSLGNGQKGEIQHAGTGVLTLKTGQIGNAGGTLATNGRAVITASALDNQEGVIRAKGAATITAAEDVNNNGGLLQTGGDLVLKGQTITNAGGKLIQLGEGPTVLEVAGALNNTAGGRIETRSADLLLEPQSLDNSGGTIAHAGAGALTLKVGGEHGAFNNTGGRIKTNGAMTLAAGTIGNKGGGLAAQGVATITASDGAIDNTSGTMLGGASLRVLSRGDLQNPSGVLQATGSLEASAQGALVNTRARIEAGASGSDSTLEVSGAGIDNSLGRIVNAGKGHTKVKSTGKLSNNNPGGEGGKGVIGGEGQVVASAGQLHNHDGGQLIASHDLTLHTTESLDNTGSKLYAKGNLTLDGGNATVTNVLGEIASGQDLSLEAGTVGKGGIIHGGRHASLSVKGNVTVNPGDRLITAADNLTWITTGALVNRGVLEAPGDLTVRAASLENQASGVISGQKATRVITPGALTNAGRIYGQDIALGASHFLNQAGAGSVVAARNSLNIGASVNNQPGGALQSEGNLNIGRKLDANHQATERADAITNHGAEIRSGGGDMNLNATRITNSNSNFTVDQVPQGTTNVVEYMPKNEQVRFDQSRLTPTTGQDGIGGCWLVPTGRMVPAQPTWHEMQLARRNRTPLPTPKLVPEMRRFDDYTKYEFKRTITKTEVQSTKPGEILAGRNMTLSADAIVNDKSRIIAGNNLEVPAGGTLRNHGHDGQLVTKETGTAVYSRTEWHGKFGGGNRRRHYDARPPYTPPVKCVPIKLGLGVALPRTPIAANPARGASAAPQAGPQITALGLLQHTATALPDAAAQAGVASGASAGSSQPQTVGNAATPIPDLSLLGSRLYKQNLDSGGSFLFQTDPHFLGKAPVPGLEVMLAGLTLDPGSRRLGDAYLETQLVAKQIRELTGRMFLSPDSANANQDFVTLMEQGLVAAKALNLQPGVMPTEAQLKALTQDCVWMVKQRVTLADGTSAEGLVPVVLLSQTRAADLKPTGALLSAKSITTDLTGSLENSGTLLAESVMQIKAKDIQNQGTLRTTGSASEMNLSAQNDLASQGLIQGHKVALRAGRDLTFQTTTVTSSASSGTRTSIAQVSQVSADTLIAQAGRDLKLVGAQVQTTGDAAFSADRNVTLEAVTTSSSEQIGSGKNHLYQSQTSVSGAQVATGGNLSFAAKKDFAATAADVRATQKLHVKAEGSVTLDTAYETTHFDEAHAHTSHGTFSSSSHESQVQRDSRTARGNAFSGGEVEFEAGKDINIKASTVGGIGDVTLVAKGKINIGADTSSESSSSYTHEEDHGLTSSGMSISVGSQAQTDRSDQRQTTQSQNRSVVGSVTGKLTTQSGDDTTVSGSDFVGKGGIKVTAKKASFLPGVDEAYAHESHKYKKSGLTVGVRSTALEMAQDLTTNLQGAVNSKGDGTVLALHSLAAAGKVKAVDKAAAVVKDALASGSAKQAASAAGVRVSAAIGTSQSESERTDQSQTHFGSTALTEGHLSILTTEGIKSEGSAFAGKNVTMKGGSGKIDLGAARDTASNRSINSSSSASLGMSAGVGSGGAGLSVDMDANQANGRSNGASATWQSTVVMAEETLAVDTDSEFRLNGAQASGKQVVVNAAKVTIESLQDTYAYHSEQESKGFSASVPVAGTGGNASVHQDQSRATGDYSSVRDQSSLRAGVGGLQVKVKEHLHLGGGLLSSDASAALNTVTAATVSIANVENHSIGSASSSGFGVSTAAVGNPLEAGKAVAGALTGQGKANHHDASTTRGAALGDFTITDGQGRPILTGEGAAATAAPVHRSLDLPDMGGLQASADGKKAINKLAFGTFAAYADGTEREIVIATQDAEADTEQAGLGEAAGMGAGPNGSSVTLNALGSVPGNLGHLDFNITERAFGPAGESSSGYRPNSPTIYPIEPEPPVLVASLGGAAVKVLGKVYDKALDTAAAAHVGIQNIPVIGDAYAAGARLGESISGSKVEYSSYEAGPTVKDLSLEERSQAAYEGTKGVGMLAAAAAVPGSTSISASASAGLGGPALQVAGSGASALQGAGVAVSNASVAGAAIMAVGGPGGGPLPDSESTGPKEGGDPGSSAPRRPENLAQQQRLSNEAQRGIVSLEKQIASHEAKLAEFRANPTVRPGMENLSKEAIQKQHASRIAHLETEINTFKANIEKIRNTAK